MKPNKYLFRAFSLVGISLLSLLLVSTTGASAHDLSQYTPVTTDQNQNNNSGNNDDNNNNDNNNNGGGGYIPGGNTGGGGVNNNGGGISTGGATAGATANSGDGSATVANNPQGQAASKPDTQTNGGYGPASSAMNKSEESGSVSQKAPTRSSITIGKTGSTSKLHNTVATKSVRINPTNKYVSLHAHNKVRMHHKLTSKRESSSLKHGLSYVKRHVHHYNKKYPRWGDDCTNFGSQYMASRGYKKTKRGLRHYWVAGKGTCHDPYRWYCNKKGKKYRYNHYIKAGVSKSWVNVNSFYTYWTKYKHLKHFSTRKQSYVIHHARLGDIIQFKDKSEKWFHTAIITKKTRHEVYYSCHTANVFNKPLRKCNKGHFRRGRNKIIKFRVIHVSKRKI